MVNRTIGTLAITLFLAGCNFATQPEMAPIKKIPESQYSDFTLAIPSQISKTIHRTDKSDAYLTYDNTVIDRQPTDFSIWVFPPESIGAKSCSPYVTGASQTNNLGDANNVEWGRVNYEDGYGREGWQYAYDPKDIVCKIGGTPPPIAVYALCSEKDGKTVVICLSQMTDNPQLAEDIFKTFRWTKE